MSLRPLEIGAIFAAATASSVLGPGTISSDAGRVLVTFLGLVAASVLPTITLLINSMTPNGRSVYSINRLDEELRAAMDALFLLFGGVCIAVMALVALAIPSPAVFDIVPHLSSEVLPRGGQAIIGGATALILWRIGQIPGILRRTLKVRHEAALEEAKLKLAANAPDAGAIGKAFATHPDFGKPARKEETG
ncbi:hypothetical protein FF80_01778 [Devosia sp. LC5]|nr:hypothetical protein FF80_01778 [Devosia sp. LC5]